MNRNRWKQLASGLLAATLSLGIAACDDDTSSGTGDMAMTGADLSATAEDMAKVAAGNGQITLADAVGTLYSPKFGSTGMAPRTHVLLSIASFPKPARTGDPSSNLTLSPPSGCLINRYDATNMPGTDGDAGDITITGFNVPTMTQTLATDTKTGSTQPTPTTITCSRANEHYSCAFSGTMNPDGGAMGANTGDVIFPVIPYQVVVAATKSPAGVFIGCNDMPAASPCWPFGAGACDPRYLPNPGDPSGSTLIEVCEQHPIDNSYAIITEKVAGGADYPASTSVLGNGGGPDGGTKMFPAGIYLVSVTQGTSTTSIAGTDPLTLGPSLSMDAPLDATKDLTITYSCDPNNPTKGAGCAGSADFVALLVQTSTGARAAFTTPGPTGVGQCIGLVPGGSITVKANQLTALLGGQTGGSIELALARLAYNINPSQPLVIATAGVGIFGFTNQ